MKHLAKGNKMSNANKYLNKIINEVADENISKIDYSVKDFDIVTDKPKDAKTFNDLTDNLIYAIESKDGNVSANVFWKRSKGKGYRGDYANLEMRGMVGDKGVIEQHFPLWTTGDEIPSGTEMIQSLIKIIKRKKY